MNTKTLQRLAALAVPCGLILLGLRGAAFANHGVHAGPEIDVGAATSGIALAAGAVLLMIERMRNR